MSAVLATREVEKPWGRDVLPAPFTDVPGKRIGEIWFEPPPGLPQLLVKYIFTSERLSVQVHPSAQQLPGHGKEECWLILDAEPGADGRGRANRIEHGGQRFDRGGNAVDDASAVV